MNISCWVLFGTFTAIAGCNRAAPAPEPEAASVHMSQTVAVNSSAPDPSTAIPPAGRATVGKLATDLCNQLCSRSVSLHCRLANECVNHCIEMGSLNFCRLEMAAALRCFTNQPTQYWECDEEGLPSVKQGVCDNEQRRYADCVQKQQP